MMMGMMLMPMVHDDDEMEAKMEPDGAISPLPFPVYPQNDDICPAWLYLLINTNTKEIQNANANIGTKLKLYPQMEYTNKLLSVSVKTDMIFEDKV